MKKSTGRALLFWTICIFLFHRPVHAQNPWKGTDYCTSGIETVLAYPVGDPTSLPIVPLGNLGSLLFSFDDLYQRSNNLQYTWVLCYSDWSVGPQMSSEYLQGFLQEPLPTPQYSFNTYQPYSHFETRLPSESMRPTRSGHYFLIVFDETPDEPLLVQRVIFYENVVTVAVQPHRPMAPDAMKTQQEVDALVHLNGYSVPNPFQDFQLIFFQNNHWPDKPTRLPPRFVRADVLDFNYDRENLFPGLNEFREFDTKNSQVSSLFVRKWVLDSLWVAFVAQEPPRGLERYVSRTDIDGGRFIRRQGFNAATEADYVWVDFALKDIEGTGHRQIAVVGSFNGFNPRPGDKLRFDPTQGFYTTRIKLKQGYYNYLYAEIVETGLDYGFTEGNQWETDNSYTVLAVHREWNLRYDRVVGMSKTRSRRASF